MPKQKLFDDESDDEIEIKTENEYAKKYNAWREKEERHKLEQKYGDKVLNSDVSVSSDSEDESDEPPEISEETETQFLKTLALLKTKDPRIYDSNYNFFADEEKKTEKETKTKTLTFEDSDNDDDDDGNIFTIEKKAEITSSDADTNKKENGDTKNTYKEGTLKDYLIGKKEHIDNEVEKDLAPLKALWSDPKLNEGEAFLRDYILNKRYLDEGDVGEAGDKIRDDDDLEADEQTVEEQGKFERAYNFRFEEPDEEYLKRFPRTMNYIRPKDDRRSRKRAEVRTRKEEEKKRKMEEISRLKALKLKEIQDKIAKIKEVTGNDDLAFEEADVEGDFDPEEHDKRMQKIFNEEYYGDADEHKPVFPDLDQELEIENWDNYEVEHEQAQDGNEDGPHCEDEDFNMDADYDPKQARANLLEEIKSTLGKKRRNRKRKSKLAEILAAEKPKYVPIVADKTYSEYMEEYYKMDCEDVVGDLPTRFKYREVVPNDYGLSVEEILLADDKELTQWVPLKKIIKYRPDNVEKSEIKTYASKAADVSLKRKVLPSLFKDVPENPEIVVPVEEATKKKKKKKKKNKQNDIENYQMDETNENIDREQNNEMVNEEKHQTEVNGGMETKEKKKKKKSKSKDKAVNIIDEDVREHSAEKVERQNDGNDDNIDKIEHEKFDNSGQMKKKKSKNNDNHLDITDEYVRENIKEKLHQQNDNVNIGNRQAAEVSGGKKKKKKKHKSGEFAVEAVQNEAPSQTSDKNTSREEKRNDNSNLKRKLDNVTTEVSKKKKKKNKINADTNEFKNKELKSKFKHKEKFQNKNEASDNPLSKLSDERLKAYGLNPKKYRGFLKYKKF